MALLDLKIIPSSFTQSAIIICNKGNRLHLQKGQQAARLPFLSKRSHCQHLALKCSKGSEVETKAGVHLKSKAENGHVKVEPTPIITPHVRRSDFPPDFKFGASTSALQTEGAGDEGGRGPSTWDEFIGEGHIAVDSYNRYKEDVQLLKDMGVNAYRLSIAWPRILPRGTVSGGINQEGIDFYNNFIDELLANGITPFVTLFHFDLPKALQNLEFDGFIDRRIIDDFANFAEICFKNFGDRVKHWTTFNEPQVFGQLGGYRMGRIPPPDENKAIDPYRVTHNIILAHATAAKLYKQKYQATQGGEIGISLMSKWFEPHSEHPHDRDAAKRATDFFLGSYLEPLVNGDYPFLMKALIRDELTDFSEEEKVLVKGSYDFIGVNYYTSRFAKSLPFEIKEHENHDDYQFADHDLIEDSEGRPIGEPAEGREDMYIYPEGLKYILIHLKKDYNNPKIYITENGIPSKRDDSLPLEEALKDDFRIEHIIQHFDAVKEAIDEGADVKGFFIWSLMDNMEMAKGYTVRFGLNYVDYLEGLNRYPKNSAIWLRSFMRG